LATRVGIARQPSVVSPDPQPEGRGFESSLSAAGAGPEGAIVEDDSGADQNIGSPGNDIVKPGRGPDTVNAEAGDDEIALSADGAADMLDRGSGADLVIQRDAVDSLFGCERVRRKPFV